MSMSFLDYIASALEVYAIKAGDDFFSIGKQFWQEYLWKPKTVNLIY